MGDGVEPHRAAGDHRSGSETALNAALRVIYGATHVPDCWDRAMTATAPLFGARKALFIQVDRIVPGESVTDAIGLAPDVLQAIRQRDLAQDFIFKSAQTLPAGSVYRSTDLWPTDVLHEGPLYERIAVPAGLNYVLGANLENSPVLFSNLCIMRDGPDFSDGEKALLGQITPHLQIALRISRRIALGDAGRREALRNFDRVGQAVVVLDRSGYAIYSNAHAEELLGAGDGLSLKFGRFHFEDIALQAEFERLARLALASPRADIAAQPQELRITRRGRGHYGLSILPVTRSQDRALLPDGAAAMVLIYDPAGLRLPLPLQRLSWFYDLTPAEARICEGLYRTGSIEAAAQDLNVTQHTVRSHLKTIYAKIGVTTQAQLMQRLTHSALLESPIDNLPG